MPPQPLPRCLRQRGGASAGKRYRTQRHRWRLLSWADHVHASVRALSRLFRAETGLSFASWRTQLRIRAAIPMLADGTSVGATARAVGYYKPSAFIAMFQRVTGQTPGTYLPRPR